MAEGWRFTLHAKARMAEMGVDRREVLSAAVKPKVRYTGSRGHPPGREIRCRGRVAIVVRPAPAPRVITVLWRGRVFVRADVLTQKEGRGSID